MNKPIPGERIIHPTSKQGFRKNPKGRLWRQIWDIFNFDWRRNIGKTSFMTALSVFVFCLVLLVIAGEVNAPPTAVDYATRYVSLISVFLIPFMATIFGAPIIVEDFEKKTGNLLFPQISRGRLFAGRYMSRLLCACFVLSVYFVLVASFTAGNYGIVPERFWGSFGFALVYFQLVLSFVTLLSAVLPRVTYTIIACFFILLSVFNMLNTTSSLFNNASLEPFYIITYYGNFITAWLNSTPPGFWVFLVISPGREVGIWRTPSIEGMIIGVSIYSTILLALTTWINYQKQLKG